MPVRVLKAKRLHGDDFRKPEGAVQKRKAERRWRYPSEYLSGKDQAQFTENLLIIPPRIWLARIGTNIGREQAIGNDVIIDFACGIGGFGISGRRKKDLVKVCGRDDTHVVIQSPGMPGVWQVWVQLRAPSLPSKLLENVSHGFTHFVG